MTLTGYQRGRAFWLTLATDLQKNDRDLSILELSKIAGLILRSQLHRVN